MDYETLDMIADSYIPVLAITFLSAILFRFYTAWPKWRRPAAISAFLFSLLLVAYGIMFADKAFNIWPRFGLDYSTHTAVSLAFVFALCVLFPGKKKLIGSTLAAYAGLMLYQHYHTVADILTTAAIIAGFSAPMYKRLLSFMEASRSV